MQEGLLLHTLLEPGTGILHAGPLPDRQPARSRALAAAWQAVVACAARASFVWNAGETMLQVIHKPGRTRIEFLDWSELPEDGHEERLQALHKREREAGFDLLEQPPFHLRLIRLGEARYWFMMSNHHILIDAWCRGLLMNDFFEIYSALGESRRRTCRRRRATATTSPGCNARTWAIATLVEREPARLRAADPGTQRPTVPPRARRRAAG